MGHVADIFTPGVLNELPGKLAIGHTRYSTSGDTVILNAQPLSVACNKGQIAVAHNGNITNAAELKKELESDGSIFQSTSDTEVVLHLVARSREKTLAAALRDAMLQIEGAFSLVFISKDSIIVARDPHGFRPLAIGRIEQSDGRTAYVFASETCAFDLVNATYMGEVESGAVRLRARLFLTA
jgi:amidophosphoribosyltransferase